MQENIWCKVGSFSVVHIFMQSTSSRGIRYFYLLLTILRENTPFKFCPPAYFGTNFRQTPQHGHTATVSSENPEYLPDSVLKFSAATKTRLKFSALAGGCMPPLLLLLLLSEAESLNSEYSARTRAPASCHPGILMESPDRMLAYSQHSK